MNVRTLSLRRLGAECDIGGKRARRGPDQRAGSASDTRVPPPGARHDLEPATRARGAFPDAEHAQSTRAGSRRNAGRVESVTVVADGRKQLLHAEAPTVAAAGEPGQSI
jgi:hypothetical protein